jgi:hypothetical protein
MTGHSNLLFLIPIHYKNTTGLALFFNSKSFSAENNLHKTLSNAALQLLGPGFEDVNLEAGRCFCPSP